MFDSNGKFHFPENGFLLTEIFTFDPEMILHPHFHFKSFPEKKREREERAQIGEHWSSIAPLVDRWAVRSSNECARRSRRSSIVTACRGRSQLTAWSHRSSINERCDWRDYDRRRRRLTSDGGEDRDRTVFSFVWVCLFLLLLQTPENIFQKIFWNATKHMKTFSFLENRISGKWYIF